MTEPAPLRSLVIGVDLPAEIVADLSGKLPGTVISFPSPGDLLDALSSADAYAAWELSDEQLVSAANLRWFQSIAAGVDGLPLAELGRRGVIVTNTSGVHAPNIAEHVIALMLAFARRLPMLIKRQTDQRWTEEHVWDVFELGQQKLAIVGMGAIGTALAARASALGMQVSGATRSGEAVGPDDVPVFSTSQLLASLDSFDHVAITLPLTPLTRGMVDAEFLAGMKPTAYLYNVGRGAVVSTTDLVAALQEGIIAGAGLDVTDPEPLPPGHPLWEMENVIITAHSSGATPHYWRRVAAILTENAIRYCNGERLMNLVDPEDGY